MLSLLTHGAKSKLPQGNHRKRLVRIVMGYTLLAVSIVTSLTTLAVSLKRPQISVLQVSAPIAAGEHVSATKVRQIAISSSINGVSPQFATKTDLAEMVTRLPLATGHLIELSDMTSPSQATDSSDEMVIPLASSKAPIDQMLPGDFLELIATVGTGSSATSRVVANAVKVIGISKATSAFGQIGQNGANVLLSISDPVEAIAIAQAETAGSLVGIKVNGPGAATFQGIFSLGDPPGQSGANTYPARQPSSIQNVPIS